jgi:putative transposase
MLSGSISVSRSRYRDAEELLAARSIQLTYKTIHQWCRKFGQAYAHQLRQRRPQPADKWHLAEVLLKINGQTHYLWRAVVQQGNVVVILVTSKRGKHAAKRFFRQRLKGCRTVPRVIITDKCGHFRLRRQPRAAAEYRV